MINAPGRGRLQQLYGSEPQRWLPVIGSEASEFANGERDRVPQD